MTCKDKEAGLAIEARQVLAETAGRRTDLDLYAEGHRLRGARKLPLNLLDALRLFEKDRAVRAGFGDSFVRSYVKLKTNEWNAYAGTISDWERRNTLDC